VLGGNHGYRIEKLRTSSTDILVSAQQRHSLIYM
jgi:hypothetical protein